MSIVETSFGRVRGQVASSVHAFRGIPFARPPVGNLRWRAPEPPPPWAGVRDALEFGPCAIQSTLPGAVGELIGIATHETGEDCLYLNIWTPAPDAAKRPVMVWIHGGGNTVGAGSQPRINGERLARIGDVVVVTLNYRLGALGFLHAPELGASGNEALLDQAAALRWVRTEIEAFGGDAGNVTVFGQSAGGFDIAQLMAMPAAEGCFDRAVPMSGSLIPAVSAEDAERTTAALAAEFGGLDKLRDVPAERILAFQSQIPGARWAPTLDGAVIKEGAADVLARGQFTRDMPLMIGHTRDESTLFTTFGRPPVERERLLETARDAFGDDAEDAIAAYEQDRSEASLRSAPGDILAAIVTDRMFRIPAARTAECHLAHSSNVWMYRFDHESPADPTLQSCHSLDIPFVWGTYGIEAMQRFCGKGEAIAALSNSLMSRYLAFARTGNPNTADAPEWPSYEITTRATMLFDGTGSEVANAPLDASRRLWMG